MIKKCFDTVDARYKHEDGGKWLRTDMKKKRWSSIYITLLYTK